MTHVRFGILSTANIGVNKVIPAMQKGANCKVTAISSRNSRKAKEAANALGIPKSYSSYEELLDDPDIDAVYNPLPNHLHVAWTLKALEAGKHVLCEKPIGLTAEEASDLIRGCKAYPNLKVMEAFMYRHHPRWQKAKELVETGVIGKLNAVHTFFSYYNIDPEDIRNKPDIGGGGLMDVGCYCISSSRFLFGHEPDAAKGVLDLDPELGTDRLASGILRFGTGTATFTCSTQTEGAQYVKAFGTDGQFSLETPFTPAPDQKTSIEIWKNGADEPERIHFEAVDQYTLQGENFSRAILENLDVPTPLQDAENNMKAIEMVRNS
ncbi:MAG: Gfo/Idh/MocA family oxidoreductase [Balneolaceae bacterium]